MISFWHPDTHTHTHTHTRQNLYILATRAVTICCLSVRPIYGYNGLMSLLSQLSHCSVVNRLTPPLCIIGCVLSYMTANAKTRQVLRVRDAP